MSNNREQGIEFGDVAEEIDQAEYPVGNEEFVAEYGDQEIAYSDGSSTLREILGPLNQEYGSAEEVRQAVFNMVNENSVGREEYSDRAGSTPGSEREQESL